MMAPQYTSTIQHSQTSGNSIGSYSVGERPIFWNFQDTLIAFEGKDLEYVRERLIEDYLRDGMSIKN